MKIASDNWSIFCLTTHIKWMNWVCLMPRHPPSSPLIYISLLACSKIWGCFEIFFVTSIIMPWNYCINVKKHPFTSINTGHIEAKLACILTTTFHGQKEKKKCLAGITSMGNIFHWALFRLKNPRIFSLRLCTDTFAVSPVGLGVSDGQVKHQSQDMQSAMRRN